VHARGCNDGRPCQCADDVSGGAALGVTTKKKSLHAAKRDTDRVQQARADYQALIQPLDCQRFKFIDELGVNLAMTRRFGRAPSGERVIGTVPQNYGANLTMIAALALHGIEAVMTIERATDAEVFQPYTEQVLGPTLRPGDIVVLDNLSAHKLATIREVIEGRGARLLYLPPYSPDLAPIEQAWSKIKTFLRAAKSRTREVLEVAIQQALMTITAADAHSWFTHCGYTVP
jgi:transposase